ncbi:hypothetical protein IJD34_07475 [bacterium]|nr:hypothetical protein [bacterium]
MKKLTTLFILSILINSLPAFADGFWNNVWDEIKFEATRSRRPSVEMNKFPNVENKIYRIGSNYVYYNSLNPDKIERIGNKSVEYKMTNDEILKIGNDYVIYSANGKILRVGNNEVLYNGDRITRIGNDEVFYK